MATQPSPSSAGAGSAEPSGGAGVPGLGSLPCQPSLPTGFCFVSDAGDYIGDGQSVVVGDGAGSVELVPSFDGAVSAWAELGDQLWFVDLVAPRGQYFVPAEYAGAQHFPENFDAPGLNVGVQGRACRSVYGSFTISELGRDGRGYFDRLAAKFQQHCEGAEQSLRGVVFVNATGTPDAVLDPTDCDVATPTGLCFASQVGHPDAGGRFVSLSSENAVFSAYPRSNGIRIDVRASGSYLNFEFDAPEDGALVPGVYAEARGYQTALPSSPTLAGCGDAIGQFEVHELQMTELSVASASIDFHYQCGEGDRPVLYGKLRYAAP